MKLADRPLNPPRGGEAQRLQGETLAAWAAELNGEWQVVEEKVPIAAGTGMVFLNLSLEGQGKIWISDLKLDGVLDVARSGKLNTFDMSFGYAFGSFENQATVSEGIAHIQAKDGRGGAGYNGNANLSSFADHCPVLVAKRGPKNSPGLGE